MQYCCPNCWQFYNEKNVICPNCGYNAGKYDEMDYTDKLINALNHRAGDIKYRIISILTEQKEKRALPYLKKLAENSKDPLLAKTAETAVGKIMADNSNE